MILTGIICFFIGGFLGAWVMFRLIALGLLEKIKEIPSLKKGVETAILTDAFKKEWEKAKKEEEI